MKTRAPSVMIRRAVREDAPAIRDCAERAYTQYITRIGRKPAPMVADFERRIREGKVWVAACDRHVLGYIVFFAQPHTMFLENVAVQPDHSGHGIGRLLISWCEEYANKAGLPSVTLYTNEMMAENLLLYPKLGYQKMGRRQEDGFNRVYFEKPMI